MAKGFRPINVSTKTWRRLRLASIYWDLSYTNVVELSLDAFGVPRLPDSPELPQAAINRVKPHIEVMDKECVDEQMENFFKMRGENDNEI